MRTNLKSECKADRHLSARYCHIGAAIVGGALIGGIASNSAASKAAKSQQGASDAAAKQAAIAQDQWDSYKETYQPLEKQYVTDAQNYDNPDNREEAAGLAASTVSSQYGKARDTLSRTPGLDPSSAAYAAGLTGLETNEAAAGAVAQNMARKNVQDQGWARRTDALSLGKGLPAQASAGLAQSAQLSSGLAAQQGQQATGIANNVGNLASKAFSAYNDSANGGLGAFYTPQFSGGSGAGASSITPVTNSGYAAPDLGSALEFGL